MIISIVKEPIQAGMSANEMKVGDVAILLNNLNFPNHIIIRAYNGVWVSLTNPATTWTFGDSGGFKARVHILPPGTKLEITTQ